MDDLIERVARAIDAKASEFFGTEPGFDIDIEAAEFCFVSARAALAIAFEEAARMADTYEQGGVPFSEPWFAAGQALGNLRDAFEARAKAFEVKP